MADEVNGARQVSAKQLRGVRVVDTDNHEIVALAVESNAGTEHYAVARTELAKLAELLQRKAGE